MQYYAINFSDNGIAIIGLNNVTGKLEDEAFLFVPKEEIASTKFNKKLMSYELEVATLKGTLAFKVNKTMVGASWHHAKLLILDPMSSYIGEDCSMNNANETRAEFNHLIAVAKDTGCAIVIIAHMNKMKDTNPLYRTNGSIDIAGAVRSIIAITRTPNKEAPSERCMVQVKSNLAPTGSAILFEVAEKGVNFISEMEMTAEQAFQSLAPKMGRPNEKEVKATEMILEMLKDGEMLTSECEEKLEAAGFKKSTIKKAKMKAGALSKKVGFQWYWYLAVGDKPNE